MRARPSRWLAGLILAWALAPAGATAQEGAAPVSTAVLARADARVYTPALAGLKDLRVAFRCGAGPGDAPRIVLYWKAPGRRVVRFERPDGTPAEGQDFLLSDAKTALELAVPVPFAQRQARPGAGGVLLEPTAGDVVHELRLWRFDGDGRPLGLRTARDGDFHTEQTFGWREEGGKLLLSEIRSLQRTDMGESQQVIRIEHQQVQGYWLPVRATIARGQGKAAPLYAWDGYELDSGVPDAVFESAYGP